MVCVLAAWHAATGISTAIHISVQKSIFGCMAEYSTVCSSIYNIAIEKLYAVTIQQAIGNWYCNVTNGFTNKF